MNLKNLSCLCFIEVSSPKVCQGPFLLAEEKKKNLFFDRLRRAICRVPCFVKILKLLSSVNFFCSFFSSSFLCLPCVF